MKKPLIFLWGDSHAASFYPGLRAVQNMKTYGIVQRTASACPPFMAWPNPTRRNCKEINDENFQLIASLKPEIVLLSARWRLYFDDLVYLQTTVEQLNTIGIKTIVLIGPVPEWQDSLSKELLLYYQHDVLRRIPPVRMHFGLVDEILGLDEHMKEMAKTLKINYVSPYHMMCNEEGCLTRGSVNSYDITSFDGSHLSPSASTLLMKGMIDDLLTLSR